MKKLLLTITAFIFIKLAIAGNSESKNGISVINIYDTVYFDLSKVIVNGNNVQFPVSLSSDDVVYTLDFSMKFDEAKLTYDSIINHQAYLIPSANYNTSDKFLRFTSNSMQPIENNKPLISIAFSSVTGKIGKDDLNSINAYLNGDLCSIMVIDTMFSVGTSESGNNATARIFPNPVADALVVSLNQYCKDVSLSIYDVTGKIVKVEHLQSGNVFSFSCKDFSTGVYFYRINRKGEESISGKFLKE